MSLASGYLPYEQAPLYQAESTIRIGSIDLVNGDSGTDSATVNLWHKPKLSTATAILKTPLNLELLAGDSFTLDFGDDGLEMKDGDEILGKCSAGTYMFFEVNGK